MLPSFLSSSYQQYKEDTNAIAAWLASTARRCGYPADLLQPSPANHRPAPRSQKLKGKARKQAKEAAESRHQAGEQAPGTATPPTRPSYIIAIKDFISLAEFIAGSTELRVKVPPTVAAVLNRSIDVRKKHAQTLASQQDEALRDEDSDNRHLYFVGILERVREILTPYMSPGATDDSLAQEQAKATEEVGHLTNSFARLDVQEPSEAFINAPNALQPSKAEPDYQAEQAQDLDEACTAFLLLLEDFERLRSAIAKTWVAYKIGMCDIVAASVTTNTALEFARHLEEDATSLLERHRGVERMLMYHYIASCWSQGQDPDYRAQPDDTLNFHVYDMVKITMWPTYQLLQAYVKLVSPTNVPLYQPGFYGTYDPLSDRRQKDARGQHQEDKIILMEILPEFALLCRMRGTSLVEDELVRGLRTAFNTKKITLWTVLAAQVFLDIHHRLREYVSRGLVETEKVANQISTSIEQHFQFHASLTIDTWPRSNDAYFRDIQRRIDMWVKGDPILQASLRHNRPPPGDRNLLSKHPVLCGLLAYGLKMQFHEAGVALANAWGSIVCTGHLYNAVRKQRLLESRWKDMEIVRGLQANAWFASAPPTTPEDFLKRFILSMGYSASNFAPGRRQHARPQASRAGPRGLEESAEVAQAFKTRFINGAAGRQTSDFTNEDLRKLLGKLRAWEQDPNVSNQEEEEEEEGGEEEVVQAFGLMKDAKPRDGKAARAHRQTVSRLGMEELLDKLRNALQGEVLELSFDYLMLHRFSWMLLRAVKEECADELRRMYGPSYMEKETELPFVVGYLFHAAVAQSQAAVYPGLRQRRTETANPQLLAKAACVMEGMIDTGAGAIVAKVLEMQYGIAFETED